MIVIYFDTNALTGMYSYSLCTIKEIVTSLEQMEKSSQYKIIIPATVYEEYERHYHKSRSRNGDKYPLAIYRDNFDKQKGLIVGRLEKIRNIKLSTIFETNIDDTIDKYQHDTNCYLQMIEREIKRLEDTACDDEIDDTNDVLHNFIECHKQPSLTLEEKLHVASLADIRFSQNIKPGLTDQNKQEEYPFQKYGDVFIWYEILNRTNNGDDVIFVENEIKGDWWEEKRSDKIAPELEKEFLEHLPSSKINLISFDTFYSTYLENYISSSESKIEIGQVRDKLKKYLNSKEVVDNLESDVFERITESEIEEYFIGESFQGGNISELNDIEILKVLIDKNKFYPCYDSDDGTVNIRSDAIAFVSFKLTTEYDKDSYPTYWEIKARIKIDIMAVYDLILNQKIISSKLSEEDHKFLKCSIYEKKSLDVDCDDSYSEIGIYGNCTECSTPINDDNLGDGTLCYNCYISKVDDD